MDTFQDELAQMYRDTGAGKDAKPPALLAMTLLLQGYLGTSDAEAVELTVMDLRWQMVLDGVGATEPAFSQGALQSFRERLIAAELDRRLLERTVELARTTGAFDPKKLPKSSRIAIDSSPLEGAGRVEDTFDLLVHAARKVVWAAVPAEAEAAGMGRAQRQRQARRAPHATRDEVFGENGLVYGRRGPGRTEDSVTWPLLHALTLGWFTAWGATGSVQYERASRRMMRPPTDPSNDGRDPVQQSSAQL